jgi:hypothetical protein
MEGINDFFSSSSLKNWKAQNLNYYWYWTLAVIFGWCSLEQLYLGSPRTFVLKNIANVFLLGYPWLYEALMATTARPQVEVFGAALPVVPISVGAGRFATGTSGGGDPVVNSKHYRFLLYSLVLAFTGIAGGDSFVTGNYFAGFVRLFSLLSVFFAPIAIFWWLYKMILYFIKTEGVLEEYWEFFGYPKPNETQPCPGFLEHTTLWILALVDAGLDVVASVFPVLSPVISLVKQFRMALVESWGFAVDAWGLIVHEVKQTAEVAAGIAQMSTEAPSASEIAAAKKGIETAAATNAAATQAGGGQAVSGITSSPLSVALAATLGFILVSSVVLSLLRAYQKNVATSKATRPTPDQRGGEGDDVPPDPRGARGDAQVA